MEFSSPRLVFLLFFFTYLTVMFNITESATVVVDGVSEWKDPTVQIGDSIIFEHKNHYNLYIFQNRRAFNLCNFTQATLLNKPNSTSYTTWVLLFFLQQWLYQTMPRRTKAGHKGFLFPAGKFSTTTTNGSSPISSGGAVSSSPVYPWPFRPRDSASPSPAPTGSILPASSPSMGPDNKGGDGIPLIDSNPAVPLPTGEVDSATIGPLPISGDHKLQVMGFHQVQRALCFVLFFVLL